MLGGVVDLIVELVPHAEALPRKTWDGDHGVRPLSGRGLRQARQLATAMEGRIDAIYSSPALRCLQTVQPLAGALRLQVISLPELREGGEFDEPTDWVANRFAPIGGPIGGAWAAGRAVAALREIQTWHPTGRVVACSHGDVIATLLAHLAAAYCCALPDVSDRGGWFRLQLRSGGLTMTEETTGR